MPKLNHVKKARKARPEHNIAVGDSYYWWQFAFSPRSVSKTMPRRSQLTRSEFLGALYDLEDELGSVNFDFDSVEDFIQQVRDLGEEQAEKVYNMPESLQESPAAETLNERAEAMETWASEMDDVFSRLDDELSQDEKDELLEEITDTTAGL